MVGASRSRKPAPVLSEPADAHPTVRYSTVNYNAQHARSTHGNDSTLTIAVHQGFDAEGVE